MFVFSYIKFKYLPSSYKLNGNFFSNIITSNYFNVNNVTNIDFLVKVGNIVTMKAMFLRCSNLEDAKIFVSLGDKSKRFGVLATIDSYNTFSFDYNYLYMGYNSFLSDVIPLENSITLKKCLDCKMSLIEDLSSDYFLSFEIYKIR